MLAACSEIAQNWREGHRHDLALAFAGLCLKQDVEHNLVTQIVQRICDINGDLEVDDRLNAIRTSYAQPTDSLLGYNGLVDCLDQSKAKRIADRIAAYSGKEFSTDITVMEPIEGDLVNFGQFSDRSNVTEAKVGTVFSRWLDGKGVYVVEKKQWMIWNGNYWEADQCAYIKKLAYDFVQEAKAALVDLKSFTDATNLLSFESVKRLENISKFAAMTRTVSASEFDTDPFVLATKDKWIDLKTGQPSNPNPDVLVSKALSVGYSPEAKCPIFLNFLNDVFESDQELISFVQQAIGYSLTGSTSEQCLFIMIGDGANGKSTFINVINRLLGSYGTWNNGCFPNTDCKWWRINRRRPG
jgi:putative DNA primase/helicase